MIRGTIEFVCDNCGKTFQGPNIEFAATMFSTPLRCPNCGSSHTMPKNSIDGLQKNIYRLIWRGLEKPSKEKSPEKRE